MEQITVVIGDRLGKGQKVAAGAEKAGARAVVVPGVAADMKLGDIMKAENATFGISFCGSGGAGAPDRRSSALGAEVPPDGITQPIRPPCAALYY